MSTGTAVVGRYPLSTVVIVAVGVVFEMSWRHISHRSRMRLQAGLWVRGCHPVGVKISKIIRLVYPEVRR